MMGQRIPWTGPYSPARSSLTNSSTTTALSKSQPTQPRQLAGLNSRQVRHRNGVTDAHSPA